MDALGIHKTAELVVYAIRNGLVNFAVRRRDFLSGACGAGLAAALGVARSPMRSLAVHRRRLAGASRFRLADVTAQAGIQFQHNSGAYGGKLLPETLGSGCAFLDYDADGWQDILLVNAMDWPGHKQQRSHAAALPQQSQRHIHRRHEEPPGSTSRCTAWAWPSAITTTMASRTF